MDFQNLAQQCAPAAHATVLQAVVRTESGFNPYAIGVVGGHLVRQPRNRDEAVATARALHAAGWNFSLGLGQVNLHNLARFDLDLERVFDGCANLRASAAILQECYARAAKLFGAGDVAHRAAFSCYYSGNFRRGFVRDAGRTSYVQRVVANLPATPGTVPSMSAPIPIVTDGTAKPAARARPSGQRQTAETSSARREAPDDGLRGRPADSPKPHAAWDALRDF